jgi:hypothetical protein
MGALSIAFDITIVGALAASWVVLIIDLFFLDKEQSLREKLKSAVQDFQPAVLGVLLFGVVFFLGSAVSRIAQDFFNDDDIWVQLRLPGHLVTEDNIRVDAYCNSSAEGVVALSLLKAPVTKEQVEGFCNEYRVKLSGVAGPRLDIQDLFHIQESAVLLDGEDKTERLRQYHDQITVLRGAAFNGFVAFALCLFGCSAKYRNTVGWAAPSLFLLAAIVAFISHVGSRQLEPPFMESTLIVLGLAGLFILKRDASRSYGTVLLLSFLATSMAFLGWWWTEALYDQQVIYSFYAQISNLAK